MALYRILGSTELSPSVHASAYVAESADVIGDVRLAENTSIWSHVTLRGDRMWEFADRLLTLALPRIRDFRGLSARQFDGKGNYTFGLTEQVMFHEIDQDRIDRVRGMDITFVTTATNDDEGRARPPSEQLATEHAATLAARRRRYAPAARLLGWGWLVLTLVGVPWLLSFAQPTIWQIGRPWYLAWTGLVYIVATMLTLAWVAAVRLRFPGGRRSCRYLLP